MTAVPPAMGPLLGTAPLTVGGGGVVAYVNPARERPAWVSALVTTTLIGASRVAGVVAVMVVPFTTVTPVAAVPAEAHGRAEANPVPDTVTLVPPAAVPLPGRTPVTVGGAT